MIRLLTLIGTFSLAVFALVGNAVSAEAGFESLFDGQTLKGWEGKPGFWSVKDGAITGQTTEENSLDHNTYLIWQGGKLVDFELRLKFRLVGGNSGVQYRSRELDKFVVGGYQADLDDSGRPIGLMYDEPGEPGRGTLAAPGTKVVIRENGKKEVVGETTSEDEIVAAFKRHDWNEYTIIAQGNHLIQMMNGLTTVDVTDEQESKSHPEGIIALQLHVGPPMTVQFKDIRLKKLK